MTKPNNTEMAGKTALITGASSGFGHEFARLLARDGANLVLVARDDARLAIIAEELAREHGAFVTVLPKDLSACNAADEIARDLDARGLRVDVLVNNAGFNVYGPFATSDGERELEMLHVHVVALTRLTKLLLPGMLDRGFGRILNMGSTGSFVACPNDSVYCATKAYVLSLSEAIAEELEGTGVTATALCPGPTRTRFAERARMADTRLFRGRVASAERVAEQGYRALLAGRRVLVTGAGNKLQTFAVRFAPRRLVTSMGKRALSEPAD